jgi:outer membrane protein
MKKVFTGGMSMRLTALILAAAMSAGSAYADTLQEAMRDAENTNPSLAASRARLDATREALPQAWAEALPQISLSAGASAARRFGGNNATTTTTNSNGDSSDWDGSANVSQLLFSSGRILSTTRSARAQIEGAVADYDQINQQLLLDVVSSYADVRQAQAVVSARQRTVENLTTQVDFSQAQFDAGVVTRTDVAQSQARLAQARTLLVQGQGQLSAAVEAYMRLVGRPPADLADPPEAEGLPVSLESALDVAGRASPVLRSAKAATEQADADVGVAASGGRLRVTLEGSSSVGGDFDDDSRESSGDSVGVRLSLPLFSGGAVRSRTRQQRALRTASNLDLVNAQRTVRESVTTSWTGLNSARSAVTSARDQVSAAELAYEGVTLERETGLRSTIEVLETEQDLLDARLALAQAERDLVVAERQMLASMGQLQP